MSDPDNVVKGPFPQKERTAGQVVLDAASAMVLDEVVVMGWTKSQNVYFASTTYDVGELLYLIEKLKYELLKEDDGEVTNDPIS